MRRARPARRAHADQAVGADRFRGRTRADPPCPGRREHVSPLAATSTMKRPRWGTCGVAAQQQGAPPDGGNANT